MTRNVVPTDRQVPGKPCPHCGVTLPKKGEMASLEGARVPDEDFGDDVLLATTETVAGYGIQEVIGFVSGSAGHMASTEKNAHQLSVSKLLNAARRAGGNAVVGMRFSATDRSITAYGTAVRLAAVQLDDDTVTP